MMSAKADIFQMAQQLRVYSGRTNRAEREQLAAVRVLQQAKQDWLSVHEQLLDIQDQAKDAEREFAANPALQQSQIWRDTINLRQIQAASNLEQCQAQIDHAALELHAANRSLQKIHVQYDQILQQKSALSKLKLNRQEAMIEDDRNTANASNAQLTIAARL